MNQNSKKVIINRPINEYQPTNHLNDLDDEVGLTFNSTVQQQNIYTNYYLDKLNFHWPIIDNSYIEKIVNYMRKNKYI